jgi:hypothetical protein
MREMIDETMEEPRAEPQAAVSSLDRVQALLVSNERLSKVVEAEPRLLNVLYMATSPESYNRWYSYEKCKRLLDPLVGYGAEQKELRTSKHYQMLIIAIDTLLPDVDF